MTDKKRKRVVVIGAGLSGLISIRCCLEEDLEPVCFEKNNYIGGLWKYREDRQPGDPACVYKGLTFNCDRDNGVISDFPDRENLHKLFTTSEEFLQYLHRYSEKYDLKRYIKYEHQVLSLIPVADHWEVTYQHKDCVKTEQFDFALVATGRFSKPLLPEIVGLDTFKGTFMHGNQFKHNQEESIKDKNVLVIGNSFTAGEVAAFVGESGKQTWLSVGMSGCSLVKRYWDAPGTISMTSPLFIRSEMYSDSHVDYVNRVLEIAMEQTLPNQDKYNLTPSKGRAFSSLMMSETLGPLIQDGKVLVKRRATEIRENIVKFADGTEIEPDTIIAATGNDISFPFLSKDIMPETASDLEMFKMTWPLSNKENHNLAFIGSALKGVFYTTCLFELQARWAVRVFKGLTKLPTREIMELESKTRKENVVKLFGKDTGQIDCAPLIFIDSVADQIGAFPDWRKFLLTDPYLAYILRYGNAYPVSYRLVGPHSWPPARATLIRMYEEWREAKGDGWTVKRLLTRIVPVCFVLGAIYIFSEKSQEIIN